MTKVYDAKGDAVSVTVVDVSGNTILQVKRSDGKDKYSAVQVGYGEQTKDSRVSKPLLGHFKKHGSSAKRIVKEFRLASDEQLPAADAKLDASIFSNGQVVDVIGNTKGKGFQGVMKRWNFGGLRATHSVSVSHRSHGSTGNRQDPGRTFPGKKMAGHLGVEQVTTLNLQVVSVDAEKGLIMVKGSVPGSDGNWVVVRDAIKRPRSKDLPFPAALRSVESQAPAVEAAPVETPVAEAPAATESEG